MADSELYARLNGKWLSACRLIFGEDVGGLEKYREWLCEDLDPVDERLSFLSGRNVKAVGKYWKNARFVSFDEIDFSGKTEPLPINDIKDIDSLVRALGERAVYSGNIVLGNSSCVEESTGIEDSHFVYGCHNSHLIQDAAFCSQAREAKCVFGIVVVGESEFCIKGGNAWKSARCFDSWRVHASSDCYSSHSLVGCQDCMFCFNLRAKSNCIGNVQLGRGEYLGLKKKLLSEIAGELKRKRRLPSLPEMFYGRGAMKQAKAGARPPDAMRQINADFARVCQLVLKKPMPSVEKLEAYLSENTKRITIAKSAASSRAVLSTEVKIDEMETMTGRLVKLNEHDSVSHIRDWPEGFGKEGLKYADIPRFIGPIAYFAPEQDFQTKNCVECPTVHMAANCFRSGRAYFSKHIGCSYWPRDSEYMYGCDSTRTSSFCIRCYNSYKLTRCFEADTSQNCTGCYFCHNCENVHDSMFCFNAKNLRYAIGNAEVGKEAFERAKKLLLSEITSSLEKTGDYKRSIYDIAPQKKAR